MTSALRWTCTVLSLLVLGSLFLGGPAHAGEGPRSGQCLPFQKDLTNPSLSRFLDPQVLIPIGPQRSILLRNGQKISSQSFAIGDGLGKQANVTVTCSASCNTTGCGIQGCDASASGCSSCWCQGIGGCNSCSCTKTSTYSESPSPRD